MSFKCFEDLECWQHARRLTKALYGHTKQPEFSKDFRLVDQITGAAISIMNNISEGFDSKSNNEFMRFLAYSRRSCSEVQNCLYVALDQNYITAETFEANYSHCKRIRKIIDGLIRHLKANNNKLSDQRTNRHTGPTDQRTNGLTDQRANGPTSQRANGLTG
jgi:four helix bundle protein